MDDEIKGKITEYGFSWGVAEFARLFQHRGKTCTQIKTPRDNIEIHITPTGLIRVIRHDGKGKFEELK